MHERERTDVMSLSHTTRKFQTLYPLLIKFFQGELVIWGYSIHFIHISQPDFPNHNVFLVWVYGISALKTSLYYRSTGISTNPHSRSTFLLFHYAYLGTVFHLLNLHLYQYYQTLLYIRIYYPVRIKKLLQVLTDDVKAELNPLNR